MDIQKYSQPNQLERYSFLWSEARLVIAALSMLGGASPIIYALVPIAPLWGLVRTGLVLAWIISGAASGYLLYRWWTGGQKLFGKKEPFDMYAFLVSVVSGLNLGITGLAGTNIGMAIFSNRLLFSLTGIVYLAAAYYLYSRWNASGQKVF